MRSVMYLQIFTSPWFLERISSSCLQRLRHTKYGRSD